MTGRTAAKECRAKGAAADGPSGEDSACACCCCSCCWAMVRAVLLANVPFSITDDDATPNVEAEAPVWRLTAPPPVELRVREDVSKPPHSPAAEACGCTLWRIVEAAEGTPPAAAAVWSPAAATAAAEADAIAAATNCCCC